MWISSTSIQVPADCSPAPRPSALQIPRALLGVDFPLTTTLFSGIGLAAVDAPHMVAAEAEDAARGQAPSAELIEQIGRDIADAREILAPHFK